MKVETALRAGVFAAKQSVRVYSFAAVSSHSGSTSVLMKQEVSASQQSGSAAAILDVVSTALAQAEHLVFRWL